MEEKIQNLEDELQAIKERNTRVEADKAWETSGVRVLSVAVITYVVAVLVMCLIGAKNFLLNALIPTVGFILSTQSLPLVKRWWIKNYFFDKK